MLDSVQAHVTHQRIADHKRYLPSAEIEPVTAGDIIACCPLERNNILGSVAKQSKNFEHDQQTLEGHELKL